MDPSAATAPLPSRILRVTAALVGLTGYGSAVVRGLNPVCNYAFEHWLLTWNHGFIKRGLVGSVLHPFVVGRSATEIRHIVTGLASLAFVLLSLALLRAGWRVAVTAWPGRAGPTWARNLLLPAVSLAFLSSSGVILAASTLGFFDHIVFFVALIAIDLVRAGRFALAAGLCAAMLAVHEMFALYGLPVVALAMVLRSRSFGARPLLWLSLPAVALVLIVASASTLPAARIVAVRHDLEALGCLTPKQVDNAVFHLENSFAENVAAQRGKILVHLLDPKIARVAWPTVLAVLGTAVALLHARLRETPLRTAMATAVLVAAALAPLLAHVFAWDATRFTHFVVMQAYGGLYAVVRLTDPAAEHPCVPPIHGRVGRSLLPLLLLGLAAWSIAANQVWRAPLMSGYIDGKGIIH